MKIFRAKYRYTNYKTNSWEHYEYIVVAATIDDVIPDVMKELPYTNKKLWEVTEVNTTKRICIETYVGIY